MHLTINMQKEEKVGNAISPNLISTHSVVQNNTTHVGFNPMAASCLETPSKNTDRDNLPKRNIPTFRINNEKQGEGAFETSKTKTSPKNKEEGASQNYRILQNMKSPYFLKKN